MRGQVTPASSSFLLKRITPADAGTSFQDFDRTVFLEDHPRGCGDKFRRPSVYWQGPGSPPRMRGQAAWRSRYSWERRITPADAGTSMSWLTGGQALQDHPRGCGDKLSLHGIIVIDGGSPPRMRGQETFLHDCNGKIRITPADAGTSLLV